MAKKCVCETGEPFYGKVINDVTGKEEDFPRRKYKIEDGHLVLVYRAYSCDSSFEARLPIASCPVCKKDLKPVE